MDNDTNDLLNLQPMRYSMNYKITITGKNYDFVFDKVMKWKKNCPFNIVITAYEYKPHKKGYCCIVKYTKI